MPPLALVRGDSSKYGAGASALTTEEIKQWVAFGKEAKAASARAAGEADVSKKRAELQLAIEKYRSAVALRRCVRSGRGFQSVAKIIRFIARCVFIPKHIAHDSASSNEEWQGATNEYTYENHWIREFKRELAATCVVHGFNECGDDC